MKFVLLFIFTIITSLSNANASLLKTHTCEGGYTEREISKATLFQNGSDTFVEFSANSIHLFALRVGNLTEGLSLLSLINSDNKSNVSVLIIGDGNYSDDKSVCNFDNGYRVSVLK
jgi:hypothetical protein